MSDMPASLPDSFIAPACHEVIEIIYQDSSILVINKPSGLLSLSGKNPANKDSVHYRLVQDYPTATMVHRLDFGTSGVMVVALNRSVNANLTKQFQARTVAKEYQAVLFGHLQKDEGLIDRPVAKANFPLQKVCTENGKPAQSYYQVIERIVEPASGHQITKVLFTPKTGRTHQLRVHSQAIGHPIIGCDLYGLSINGVNSESLASRLMLHAKTLRFDHPLTGEQMKFDAGELCV